jgi:2-polyprenyl-3-methyl-5-hydroxy-6-metoxy-1,4-benzoquinol methylase
MPERRVGERSDVWSEAAVRAFWERELDFPEHYFSAKYGPRIITELRRYISAGGKVLDYGCGRGALSERLCLDIGAEVWATDGLPGAVTVTNRLNATRPGFHGAFHLEEIRRFAGIFDAIVAIELLEHLADTALRDFFSTAGALVRPAGYLIVTTPNRERLETKDVLCPTCGTVFHRWQHIRSVDAEQLARWGAAVGFTLTEVLETDFSRAGRRFSWPGRRRARGNDYPHLMGVFVRSARHGPVTTSRGRFRTRIITDGVTPNLHVRARQDPP